MLRRLTAVIGTLAFVLTILPAVPDTASLALECCNGVMCPMHEVQGAHCDTDHNDSAALRPCPVQAAVRYTATTVFVLLAPAVLYHEMISEPANAYVPNFDSDVEAPVDTPPPRVLLTA